MSDSYELKTKHLEFIQAVIARMATNSFVFKGWTISIAAGLSGFAVSENRPLLFFIASVSAVLFWGLDGYYLWLERGFVALYKKVSLLDEHEIDFSMEIDRNRSARRWFCTCWRPHLWIFYGTIASGEIVFIVFARSN